MIVKYVQTGWDGTYIFFNNTKSQDKNMVEKKTNFKRESPKSKI